MANTVTDTQMTDLGGNGSLRDRQFVYLDGQYAGADTSPTVSDMAKALDLTFRGGLLSSVGPSGPVAPGERASAGTVGYLGDPGDLIVLNPGDSFVGTVFEGTSTTWDGNALLINASNLVIDGYRINASVTHTGGLNLTVRNSVIVTPQGQFWCLSTDLGPGLGNFLIEDTTIIGTPGPGISTIGTAVGCDGRLVLRRCDISGVGDMVHPCGYQGANFAGGTIISQCYLHDGTFLDNEQHADYIQCTNTNSGYLGDAGQTFITIEHCATDISLGPAGVAYSSGFTSGHTTGGPSEFVGPHLSLKVDNCYMPSGAYHLRIQARMNNCVVTNNDFGFRNAVNDEFGLSAIDAFAASTITWSNNIDGNGNPYVYGSPGPDAP